MGASLRPPIPVPRVHNSPPQSDPWAGAVFVVCTHVHSYRRVPVLPDLGRGHHCCSGSRSLHRTRQHHGDEGGVDGAGGGRTGPRRGGSSWWEAGCCVDKGGVYVCGAAVGSGTCVRSVGVWDGVCVCWIEQPWGSRDVRELRVAGVAHTLRVPIVHLAPCASPAASHAPTARAGRHHEAPEHANAALHGGHRGYFGTVLG
jgi:hypothetical protein